MITPCVFLFLSDTSLKDPDREWKQNSWAVLLRWTGRAFEWAAGVLGVAFDLVLCGLVTSSGKDGSRWESAGVCLCFPSGYYLLCPSSVVGDV